MKREELRKVEWKNEFSEDRHTGYFHMWYSALDFMDGFQVTYLNAVVETEKGDIIYLEPKEIRFIDNDQKERKYDF